MVNPTGYTALDMIGFTDQGAYSSSDNYVKNDLVHYSGNIWRCLIDDTTGIAPAEGVNWTLFIGEPTNLVERIIAPVETDPATNSWAVGRQIIYNDNLYEVIAAITAGDALVAYEDDPTNANIKLADPVETQLLNVKGNLSNRNLLDNPWFTVNQRGETSSYFADRWQRFASELTFTNNNGVTISGTPSSAGENLAKQSIEWDRLKDNIGKPIALSVLIGGNIYTVVGKIETPTSSWRSHVNLEIPSLNIWFQLLTNGTSPSVASLYIKNINTDAINATIKAIKLELGSISTLAMDTAPNYAEELLKCQRYFWRTLCTRGEIWGFGKIVGSTEGRMTVVLPNTMRTTPTVSISDLTGILLSTYDGTTYTPTAVLVHGLTQNRCTLSFTISDGVGGISVLGNNTSTSPIISLSADL